MPSLLTDLTITNGAGTAVDLMVGSKRLVTQVSGLSAINAREVVTPLSARTGSRNITRFRDDNPIVINGILYGDNADDTWTQYGAVADAFVDAVTADQLLRWTSGFGLPLQRYVRTTSFDAPLTYENGDMINYQATLRSSDPNSYSQVTQTASATFASGHSISVVCNNGGYVATPPIITLTGTMSIPTITLSTGGQIAFRAGGGMANSTIVIDTRARTVTLDGTLDEGGWLSPATTTWFDLPPGPSTVRITADSTSGATTFVAGQSKMQVQWADAYA